MRTSKTRTLFKLLLILPIISYLADFQAIALELQAQGETLLKAPANTPFRIEQTGIITGSKVEMKYNQFGLESVREVNSMGRETRTESYSYKTDGNRVTEYSYSVRDENPTLIQTSNGYKPVPASARDGKGVYEANGVTKFDNKGRVTFSEENKALYGAGGKHLYDYHDKMQDVTYDRLNQMVSFHREISEQGLGIKKYSTTIDRIGTVDFTNKLNFYRETEITKTKQARSTRVYEAHPEYQGDKLIDEHRIKTFEKIKETGGLFSKILSFAPLLLNLIPGFQGLGFIAQTLWTATASAATSFVSALATGAGFKQALLGAVVSFGTSVVAAAASKVANNLFHGLPALSGMESASETMNRAGAMSIASMGIGNTVGAAGSLALKDAFTAVSNTISQSVGQTLAKQIATRAIMMSVGERLGPVGSSIMGGMLGALTGSPQDLVRNVIFGAAKGTVSGFINQALGGSIPAQFAEAALGGITDAAIDAYSERYIKDIAKPYEEVDMKKVVEKAKELQSQGKLEENGAMIYQDDFAFDLDRQGNIESIISPRGDITIFTDGQNIDLPASESYDEETNLDIRQVDNVNYFDQLEPSLNKFGQGGIILIPPVEAEGKANLYERLSIKARESTFIEKGISYLSGLGDKVAELQARRMIQAEQGNITVAEGKEILREVYQDLREDGSTRQQLLRYGEGFIRHPQEINIIENPDYTSDLNKLEDLKTILEKNPNFSQINLNFAGPLLLPKSVTAVTGGKVNYQEGLGKMLDGASVIGRFLFPSPRGAEGASIEIAGVGEPGHEEIIERGARKTGLYSEEEIGWLREGSRQNDLGGITVEGVEPYKGKTAWYFDMASKLSFILPGTADQIVENLRNTHFGNTQFLHGMSSPGEDLATTRQRMLAWAHETNQDIINKLKHGDTAPAFKLTGEVDHLYVDLRATGHGERDPVTGKITQLYNYQEQNKDPHELERHEEGDNIWTKESRNKYEEINRPRDTFNVVRPQARGPFISPMGAPLLDRIEVRELKPEYKIAEEKTAEYLTMLKRGASIEELDAFSQEQVEIQYQDGSHD